MVKFAKSQKITQEAQKLVGEGKHQEAYDLLMQAEVIEPEVLGELGEHFLKEGEYEKAIDLYAKMGECSCNPKTVERRFHKHVQTLQQTQNYDKLISVGEALIEKGYKKLEDSLKFRKVNYKLKEHEELLIAIQNKMNEMITEINNLQKQKKSSSPVQVPEEKQTVFKEKDKQKTKPTNRSGDYTPGDVDINEFFYSGSKKR